MIIKTTINLKVSQCNTISAIALQYGISKSFIINFLARKAMRYFSQKNRFLQRVQYQDRRTDDCESWHRFAVSFKPVIYEKCLDLRKLSKISVSFFISLAFEKFIDQLIEELVIGNKSDNYSDNYIVFLSQSGSFKQITLLWDIIDPEKLIKIKETHT